MCELPPDMSNSLKLKASTGTSEMPEIKGEHLVGHPK